MFTCTAMKPPDDKPDTVISSSILYVPSAGSAAKAAEAMNAMMAMVFTREKNILICSREVTSLTNN